MGEPKGQTVGEAQGFCCFCIKRGKWERIGGFFLGKTCEPLFVRGTTSFYNKKFEILPIGEGVVWNVWMWLNEQCWRGTISFSIVFH